MGVGHRRGALHAVAPGGSLRRGGVVDLWCPYPPPLSVCLSLSLSLSIYIYIYIYRSIDSSVGRITLSDPEGPAFDPGVGHN